MRARRASGYLSWRIERAGRRSCGRSAAAASAGCRIGFGFGGSFGEPLRQAVRRKEFLQNFFLIGGEVGGVFQGVRRHGK